MMSDDDGVVAPGVAVAMVSVQISLLLGRQTTCFFRPPVTREVYYGHSAAEVRGSIRGTT